MPKAKVKRDTKKVTTYISPKGIGRYLWLRKPDTRFDQEGKFAATLELNPKDEGVPEFIEALKNAVEESGGKHGPVKDDVDKGGKKTGKLLVSFKSSFKPQVFDSKRNLIPEEVVPGTGSVIKVAYTVNFYDVQGGGVNLYLKGVQILDFKEYTGTTAQDMGFAEEEGGWSPDASFDPEEFGDGPPEGDTGKDSDDLPM